MTRKSFTIIELIVTIFILAISFMAIPSIINNTVRSAQWLSSSQGMYYGVSKINIVRGKMWDENNEPDVKATEYYGIVSVEEDSGELKCDFDKNSPRYGLRNGSFAGENRRKCSQDLYATKKSNFRDENFNDIDDYDGDEDKFDNYSVTTSVDYVRYKLGAEPGHGSFKLSVDDTSASTTPIKKIKIKVSKGKEKQTEYVYYATNIGLTKPIVKTNNDRSGVDGLIQ